MVNIDDEIYKLCCEGKPVTTNSKYSISDHLNSFAFRLLTIPIIKKVIFNNPATIVIWSDGTKTISKCSPNDTFDKMKGFLTCYYKKISDTTNSQFSKLYDKFEQSDVINYD